MNGTNFLDLLHDIQCFKLNVATYSRKYSAKQ